MKNKILALLISLGCISLFLGLFMLLFLFPEMCWLYMGASMLFLIYQGYTFWLQKLTNKNKCMGKNLTTKREKIIIIKPNTIYGTTRIIENKIKQLTNKDK